MRPPTRPAHGGRPLSPLFRALLDSGAWAMEAKVDGVRAVWDGSAWWSRHGRRLATGPDLHGAPALDGELLDGELWAFDLPLHPGTYDQRRRALSGIVDGLEGVRLVPQLTTWEEAAPYEGVVMKLRSSLYRCKPHDWLKFRAAWLR